MHLCTPALPDKEYSLSVIQTQCTVSCGYVVLCLHGPWSATNLQVLEWHEIIGIMQALQSDVSCM